MFKTYLAQTFLFLLLLSCDANSQDNKLQSFLGKFESVTLPINPTDGCGERNANDESNITEYEALEYLGIDGVTWKYESDYYYNTGCSFEINNNLKGVIFFRSFLPFNFSEQVSESVLLVLDKRGKAKGLLPIGGNKGDDLSYSGNILKDFSIKIKYEELELDESKNTIRKNRTETYKIDLKTGKISSFKQ